MKFPANRARLASKVTIFLRESDYESIYTLKKEIVENYPDNVNDGVWAPLIKSALYLHRFDDAICLGEQVIKARESYEIIFYMLLAALANVDIYMALSIIERSELLNTPLVKSYRENDGANYTLLINLKSDECKVLTLVNFIEGLIKETSNELTKNYLVIRLCDLLDTIYEIGYEEEVVLELGNYINILFLTD